MEQLHYNLLYRWFVGLGMDDPVRRASSPPSWPRLRARGCSRPRGWHERSNSARRWSSSWVPLMGMLAFPALVSAQTLKEADLVGGWRAELEHADSFGKSTGWLVLWPDGLWAYGGPLMWHKHGGARWQLVGDTLWLANDYEFYYHKMIAPRMRALQEKGNVLGVMDMDVIRNRVSFPVTDSIYWSKTFRDTTSECAQGTPGLGGCGTWVYKVSKKGQQFALVRLDSLSRATESVATKVVLKRDSLVNCNWLGCR